MEKKRTYWEKFETFYNENGSVETRRWRARKDEDYYYVNHCGTICETIEKYHPTDDLRHGYGNYFREIRQANRLVELLMDYHEELGE